jgi:signal transduction histidine kinase
MQPGQYPDAIDTRLVLRIYGWITVTASVFLYLWPLRLFFPELLAVADLAGLPFGRYAILRTAAAVVAAMGMVAIGFSRVEDPVSRRRGLYWFAWAHLLFGAMFFIQWHAISSIVLPSPALGWTPLVVGLVLLYIAATCAHAPRLNQPFRGLFDGDAPSPVLIDRARPGMAMDTLRSQYEQQIRQAARMEERTRLARDLHDAIKQQLFAIQTSAATAQTRFTSDRQGAQAALEQVRTSARDAMTEMEAMIGQLQAAPLENAGLVAALRQQCEALELRTGATVTFEVETLPPNDALPPGTQQALFRAAQEALANIARHARATHVTVRLGAVRDNLELTIRDDGAGFDQGEVRPGMGIESMKARVCEVSGTFLMTSKPGRGTTVGFSVPFDSTTPGEFGTKALVWLAVLALMVVSLTIGDDWERPWNAILAAIAAITVARYAAAWYRVRHRAP